MFTPISPIIAQRTLCMASRENGPDGLDRLQHCPRKAMRSFETIQVHRHRGAGGFACNKEASSKQSANTDRPSGSSGGLKLDLKANVFTANGSSERRVQFQSEGSHSTDPQCARSASASDRSPLLALIATLTELTMAGALWRAARKDGI